MEKPWQSFFEKQLFNITDKNLIRKTNALVPISETKAKLYEKELIIFSGNDYLGLSSHYESKEFAAKILKDFGMGHKGSPLICGHSSFHEELVQKLAKLKNSDF